MKPLEELLEIAKSATQGEWMLKRCPAKAARVLVTGIDYDLSDKEPVKSGSPNRFKPVEKSEQILAKIEYSFNDAEHIATFNPETVIDLITQLKDARAEIKSLSTFNTQFTRADKISWGGLYIQVEQLEQRLKDAQVEIDWRNDNYYKLDDVNCKLNERIVKLEQRLAECETGFIHTCHDECQRPLCLANREIDKLKLENAELKELRIMNLAGISTASFQNTRESTKERITKDNPYWTAAYDDVCRTVDREINLRESLDVAREALAKLERGSLLDHIATEALQNINTLTEGK